MYLLLQVKVQCHGRSKSFLSSVFKESKEVKILALAVMKSFVINHSLLLQTIKPLWWDNIPQNSHGSLCVLVLLHKMVKGNLSSATFPFLVPKSQLTGWEHV